jgi:hypothetical protein
MRSIFATLATAVLLVGQVSAFWQYGHLFGKEAEYKLI